MSTNITLIDTVREITKKLSDLRGSNNLSDLILNFKLLILYVTHNEIEKIHDWMTAYDVQANMVVRGQLVSCTVHPSTLPLEEEELLQEDICILTEFVEYVRKQYANKIA